MFTKLIMVLIMVSMVCAEWRWADDTTEFTMDKQAHFVGSGGAYFFFRHKDYTEKESILYAFYLGLAKETIDAVLPWEKYGTWGGDGFSKYDLVYDVAGILCAWGLDKVWKPKENKNDFRIGFNNTGISFSFRFH